MNNYQMKKFMEMVTAVSVLVLLSMQPISVVASSLNEGTHGYGHKHYGDNKRVIRGVAVTGVNNVLGKPYFNWGEPFGPFGFPTMFVYNENGQEPLPIDENTPDSAILATGVTPTFLIITGATPDDVKPEWVNVPLREVPVNIDFAFVEKETLRGVLDAEPLEVAQAEPAKDITLGQWMNARGVAKIVCANDRATIKLRMKSLLPNRMYSVIGTLGLPHDGSATSFFPIPLGGTPNVFVTDEDGDAEYERLITFCPLDPESTNRPLLTINVQYHANHQNYGAVPEPGFIHGLWTGIITFNHLQFPINVERLEQ